MELHLPRFDSEEFVNPAEKYVAFMDILGFGALVIADWNKARETLQILATQIPMIDGFASKFVPLCEPQPPGTHVQIEMYSDSIVLAGTNLYDVAYIAQQFQMGAIAGSFLLRGCIAKGEHAQAKDGTNTFFLSKALVLAARGEQRAIYPRVILDRSAVVPQVTWSPQGVPLNQRLLLEDSDGFWMVNPFFRGSEYWCQHRLDEMLSKHAVTEHAPKYYWIKNLYTRVQSGS